MENPAKTFICKKQYNSELCIKVKKRLKKGCLKFAKAEKGSTFALAITKKFTDILISANPYE